MRSKRCLVFVAEMTITITVVLKGIEITDVVLVLVASVEEQSAGDGMTCWALRIADTRS